jgi:uncharacterized SAM-binding protein YcdF (DUF218 family)
LALSPRRLALLLPLSIVLLLILTHSYWLRGLAYALIAAEPPVRADAILVLAGDGNGNRIMKACELMRAGYAPIALVSGPDGNYGYYDSDLAIPYAVKRGCAPEWFVAVPNSCRSTRDEAALFGKELRRRGVKRLLLVTSDFHTRRAGRLFRAALPEVELHVVAAPDVDFKPDDWWHSRQAAKVFVNEWTKTVAEWLGV